MKALSVQAAQGQTSTKTTVKSFLFLEAEVSLLWGRSLLPLIRDHDGG